MLHATPRELQGRVISVFSTLTNLVGIAAVGLVGALASLLHNFHATLLGMTFGALDTIFLAAGVVTILAGVYAMTSLRGVRIETAKP
jgi:hypothetical protein